MSETPTVGQFAQAAADLCSHGLDGACVDCIEKAIAAAEERGRRAGIEEAAKRADEWYLHESHEPHSPGDAIRNLLTQRDLAPRDSGKDTASELRAAVERKP